MEFPKPTFAYAYDPAAEIDAMRTYRDTKPGRAIPAKATDKLLVATWNIANLGQQDRREQDYRLLAEIISWFDIIALQEVNDDLSGLRGVMRHLPGSYETLFSDKAGNNERMAYLFDTDKVTLLEMVGEVAIPPADKRYIKLEGTTQEFDGFDRNPFLAAFEAGGFRFVLVNVHLYYGNFNNKTESRISMNRRSLETFAVGRWADLRRDSDNAYAKDIIVLGDFNLPKVEAGDPIYEALKKRGLRVPEHSNQIGSNLAGDAYYDQIAFFPGETEDEFTGEHGVVDFDSPLFQDLRDDPGRTQKDFDAYMRYYVSDHRVMWGEFRI